MSRTPLFRQTGLADFAQDMKQEFVRFLDARSGIAFYRKIDIGHANGRSTVAAEQRDRFESPFFSFVERTPDIGRFAARANGDENVSRFSESRDLSRKDFLEAVIICRRRDQAPALRQIHCRVRPAIFHESARELRAKIGRIRRAPAVAANEKFISRAQTFADQIRGFPKRRVKIDKRLQCFRRARDCCSKNFGGVAHAALVAESSQFRIMNRDFDLLNRAGLEEPLPESVHGGVIK